MRNTKRWMWHIKNTTIIATKMAEDLFCRLRTNWAPLRLHFLVWKVSSHLIFNILKATYIQKGMKSSYFISFLYTCCFYWKKAKKKKIWNYGPNGLHIVRIVSCYVYITIQCFNSCWMKRLSLFGGSYRLRSLKFLL